jgi:hypothetical protein
VTTSYLDLTPQKLPISSIFILQRPLRCALRERATHANAPRKYTVRYTESLSLLIDILCLNGFFNDILTLPFRFNQFVVQYREEYQATPKGKKKALADTVLVDLMKAAPCRFLRLHSNGWYYDILGTSRKDVVEKIFQTLRAASLKGKNEDSGTLQSSTSGTSSSSSKRIKSS